MRFRNLCLIGGSLVIIAALLLSDPDQGLSTGMLLLSIATGIVAVALAHLMRKGLLDYPEADMRTLFGKAREGSTGAGLALVAIAIILYGLLGVFGPVARADVRTFVPAGAKTYAPMLKSEQVKFWADHHAPEVLAGLVEQESCITLTHPRCWNPASRLKTAREEGAGMGQITRAYRPNGALRFDSLSEMRSRHPSLREWSWANVYQRPDLQLRAIVLMSRSNYLDIHRVVPNQRAALNFADAAYNGGLAGVQSDRRACALKPGCDPQRWFGHVELTCTKSRAALYGQRSACDINREHVLMVMSVRSNKYKTLMGAA